MSTVDIDRDAARDAAQHELAQPIYPRPSVTERLAGWLDDLLYRIQVEGSSIPGGWLTVTVLVLLLIAALTVAVRVVMRASRSRRSVDALFETGGMTAAQYRAIALGHAARGEWTAAIRHRLRSVARELEETAVLAPTLGRTATELGSEAAAAIPDLDGQFRRAANTFNDVTYGEQPGTEQGYRQIAELDEHLRTRATSEPAAPATTPAAAWAEVG